MPDNATNRLRQAFQSGYAELKARLARKLGSQDLAAEALHETWFKLQKVDEATVENPGGYVYRAALHTALNLKRSESRRQKGRDDRTFEREPDNAPAPDLIVQSRADFLIVLAALEELTPRQQDIFTSSFTENVDLAELAKRHGVSTRTAQLDLQRAVNHCRRRLEGKSLRNTAPRGVK